jgi:uncharacterized protein
MLTSDRKPVTVFKLDLNGREMWRYEGVILEQTANSILLEARFNREDSLFHGIQFRRNDRFVETFYNNRWYNIFEIHDREDDHLKGWYCNVGFPAEFKNGAVSYRDLALDLLVFPDGRQLVLDEDEFACLELTRQDRRLALIALKELQEMFSQLPVIPVQSGESPESDLI